jgi:hypothetical protein
MIYEKLEKFLTNLSDIVKKNQSIQTQLHDEKTEIPFLTHLSNCRIFLMGVYLSKLYFFSVFICFSNLYLTTGLNSAAA